MFLVRKGRLPVLGGFFSEELANVPPGQSVGKRTPPKSGGLRYRDRGHLQRIERTKGPRGTQKRAHALHGHWKRGFEILEFTSIGFLEY